MSFKIKKIRKVFSLSVLAIATITLSSCSVSASTVGIGIYDLWAKYDALDSYITTQNSDDLKWMSQREISLVFSLKSKSTNKSIYRFGTAWIFGKDNADSSTYYLGTNIHVLCELNDLNNATTRYEVASDGTTSLIEEYTLTGIFFNFIDEPSVSSTITNSDGSLKYLWTEGDYIEQNYIQLDPSNISIVYTATGANLVDDYLNSYVNPFNDKQVINPAIDFGLLKVNFTGVEDKHANNDSSKMTVQDFLNTYDLNPTKFKSTNEIDYSDTFFISGFPEDDVSWKPNKNCTWLGLTNIKLTPENEFVSLGYDNRLDYVDLSSPTNPMPPVGGIDYVTNENGVQTNWYRDVAHQIIVGSGNLGGGASGSMFVEKNANGDRAIAGIYWGVYEYSAYGIIYSYGAVDLLRTDSYSYSTFKNGIKYNYVFPGYNLIDSIANNPNINVTPEYV